MFCRGGGGANGLHRSKHLYQCPHDDWKGFYPTTALSGEGEEDITWTSTAKHLHLNSPPFLSFIQVSKVWVTKFGLLLERKNTTSEAQLCPQGYVKHPKLCMWIMQSHTGVQIVGVWRLSELFLFLYREPLPTIFSMLHPLDEIAPIVCKPGGNTCATPFPFCSSLSESGFYCLTLSCVFSGHFEGSRVQYASDATMTIVFSCCQPSLVVSYDTVQAIHSVWVLRKVTSDVRWSYTQVHKPKCGLPYPQDAFFICSRSVPWCCGARSIQ